MGDEQDENNDLSVVLGGPGVVNTGEESQLSSLSSTDLMASPLEQLAASQLVITRKARLEIVQNQLLQFVEILTIKLRRMLMHNKLQAEILKGPSGTEQQKSGGIMSVVSTVSTTITTLTNSKLLLAVALLVIYRMSKVVSSQAVMAVSGLHIGQSTYQRWDLYSRIRSYDNVVRAFGHESGEDELTQESTVRNLAKLVGIRHINQVTRLSKNGQTKLSNVVVRRIGAHLSRHPHEFKWESRNIIVSNMQHRVWSTINFVQGLYLPADRLKTPKKLSLNERCIRALTSEVDLINDETPLEMETYLEADAPQATKWTSNGILAKTGICVRLSDRMEYYTHEQSEHVSYGFCYGSREEAEEREMTLLTGAAPQNKSKL